MSKKRYDEKEKLGRIGVVKTHSIVIEDLGWIFREIETVDVGIDAILEEVIDSDPSGKFIAVQIKSGKGNFHVKEKTLTYYVSEIHKNYWINLNIPIILVGYIEEDKECYWQIINKNTLKKTRTGWKLIIPKQNLLNRSNKELTKLLRRAETEDIFSEIYSDFEAPADNKFLLESLASAKRMKYLYLEENKKLKSFNLKRQSLIDSGKSLIGIEIKNHHKKSNQYFINLSERMRAEINILSDSFPQEIVELKLLFLNFQKHNILDKDVFISSFKETVNIFNDMISFREGIIEELNQLTSAGTNFVSNGKKFKKSMIETNEVIVNEYTVAREIVLKNISYLENLDS